MTCDTYGQPSEQVLHKNFLQQIRFVTIIRLDYEQDFPIFLLEFGEPRKRHRERWRAET